MASEVPQPRAAHLVDHRLSLPDLEILRNISASANSSWSEAPSTACQGAGGRRGSWATVESSPAFRNGWTSTPKIPQKQQSSSWQASDDGASDASFCSSRISSRPSFRSSRAGVAGRGSLVQGKIDQFLQAARRGSGADDAQEGKLKGLGLRAKEAWDRFEVKARDAVTSVPAARASVVAKAKTDESFYAAQAKSADDVSPGRPPGRRARLRSDSEPPVSIRKHKETPPLSSRAAPADAGAEPPAASCQPPDHGTFESFASSRASRPQLRTTVEVLHWPPLEPREQSAPVAHRPAILHVCGRWSDDEDDSGDDDQSSDGSSSGSSVDTSEESADEVAPVQPPKKDLSLEEIAAASSARERRVATPLALEVFRLADRDGDGRLGFDDLLGLLQLIRWEPPESPDSVCMRAWKDLAHMGRNFSSSHWLRTVFGPLPARSSAVTPLEPAPGPLSAAELRLMASALRCQQSPRAAAVA